MNNSPFCVDLGTAGEPPKDAPLFTIDVDVFGVQVGVFGDDQHRIAVLEAHGVETPPASAAAFATAHMDVGVDGKAWFGLVIKPEATRATWAHECVHIADFVMDHIGIPTGVKNTEVRAYLVGHLFAGLEDGFGEGGQ